MSTASIGVAVARGASRRDELLRDADAAMYRAKQRGRDRFELFDRRRCAAALGARLRIERALRGAVERGELHVHYQPIVDLRRVAVAASRRWCAGSTPSAALIAPADFIPLAEETGLIGASGDWVLRDGVPAGVARGSDVRRPRRCAMSRQPLAPPARRRPTSPTHGRVQR